MMHTVDNDCLDRSRRIGRAGYRKFGWSPASPLNGVREGRLSEVARAKIGID